MTKTKLNKWDIFCMILLIIACYQATLNNDGWAFIFSLFAYSSYRASVEDTSEGAYAMREESLKRMRELNKREEELKDLENHIKIEALKKLA